MLHPGKAALELGYSLAHGLLDPGKQSLWHRLKSSEVYYFIAGRGVMKVEEASEVYYFLAGSGRFLLENESHPIAAGTVVYVPPGAKQSLINTGTESIEFLCLVEPAWKAEDEAVVE